ncbi:hypothetical protein EPI10_001139 [Gossypium australe]|uniref:Uncharacterized protein n=1 Tax=Gossypium australe TaxID=47621 RepID=A0A5B6V9Z1_9ROSI|nr:hypothetical protein EPI10_001139 [Gossypium australe]
MTQVNVKVVHNMLCALASMSTIKSPCVTMPEIFVTSLKLLIKASIRMKELMMSYHFFDNINRLKALGKSCPNK